MKATSNANAGARNAGLTRSIHLVSLCHYDIISVRLACASSVQTYIYMLVIKEYYGKAFAGLHRNEAHFS